MGREESHVTMRTSLRWLGVLAVVCLVQGQVPAAERTVGPWDLDELARPPAVTWGKTNGLVRELYYTGEPYLGKPTRVFAYLGVPKQASGKLPGMVLVHGGGGTAFAEWADLWAKRGYIAIAMDLGGKGPGRKPLPDGGPDQTHVQKFDDIAKGLEVAWPYHAVANVIRAHSLLRSLPQVDPDRIGLTGISWGGYLTCITAGVDDRFKVAVPVYGCGFLHEDSSWVPVLEKLKPEHRRQWIETYDPSVYLPRCRMPMLFVNGTNDTHYRPGVYRKSYRLVPGPRTLCFTVGMKHSHPHGWAPVEIGLFIDSLLTKGKPLAEVGPMQREGKRVGATFTSTVPIERASLCYTTDKGHWPDRTWHKLPAKVEGEGGRVTAELPQTEGIVYFMTLVDARGATVSTEHEVLP